MINETAEFPCPSTTFTIDGKAFETKLEDDKLLFTYEEKGLPKRRYIAFQDVLQVHVLQQIMNTNEKSSSSSSDNEPTSAIVLDYVKKYGIVSLDKVVSIMPNSTKNHMYEPAKIVMKCPSKNFAHCEAIAAAINDHIQTKETQRPKKLLVFINPVSGKRKGESIYNSKVHPLFQMVGIQTDVILTQHAHHASEVLSQYDLQSIDGVISVGGDGSFTQVVNALAMRVARDRQTDVHDPEMDFGQLPLRVGIIPAGTGQGCVYMMTGRYDPVTAALHIILGTQMEVNMASVHCNHKLVHYATMMAAYGMFGDVIKESEASRGLGTLRYPVSMFKHFVKFRKHNVEIQILPDKRDESSASAGWVTEHGPFVGANMFLWDFMSANSDWSEEQQQELTCWDRFINYNQSWQKGCMYLHIIDNSASRMHYLKAMKTMMSLSHLPDSAQSRIYSCDAFRVRILSEPNSNGNAGASNVINIDGDPFTMEAQECEIRLKRRMLKVFGSGIDEQLLRSAVKKKGR